MLLRRGDEGVERFALRRPPAAVVHEVRVAERQLVLHAECAAVEHHLLQLAMRGVEHGAARRLVHAARLHPDETIFDDVGAADAVLARDFVQLFQELDRTQGDGIDTDGIAFLEADRHDDRLIGRVERILRHDEDVLGRFLGRILQDPALVRAVP